MTKSDFKVVIVGGGIGGLALANSLQHAGIDYVLVERRDRLDPQLGSSIGILPNGARILDQLGCYNDLDALTINMDTTFSHREDGSVIGGISDSLQLMRVRTGYSVFFLDRHLLLQVLANRIQERHRIILNKTVERIDQSPEKATVHLNDGSAVEGDVVVGADGVYSFSRQEMWRHAEETNEGEMFAQDKNAMTAEYKCLFGVSKSISGMIPGQTDRTYAQDMSTLSYVGKGGRLFWFVFAKMDKVYRPPDIPRFSEDDASKLVDSIGSLRIRASPVITVKDLYENRVASNLVAIEEAEYQHWVYGRVVCLGDSIHKMTPNLGAGASSAIEDAAVLSNSIVAMASRTEKLTRSSISESLSQYQASRQLRSVRAMRFSNKLTRVQALESWKDYIYTHYVLPRADDFAAEMFSSFVIGAPKIEHLPTPMRSTKGTMPFNPKYGWGYEEAPRKRFIRASPLLLVAVYSLLSTYKLIPATLLGPFESSGPDSKSCEANSLLMYTTTYAIWLLEAARLNNKGSFLQYPLLFGLAAQYFSLSVVLPVYFCIMYRRTPIESFRAADNRLIDVAYARTAGVLVSLLCFLPRCLSCFSSVPPEWQGWLEGSLYFHPFILSASQFILSFAPGGSSIRYDRIWNVTKDVNWVRGNVCLILSLLIVLKTWVLASSLSAFDGDMTFSLFDVSMVRLAVPVAWWLVLVFQDFHQAGMMLLDKKVALLAFCAVFALLGPSGLLLVGWAWREETFIRKRHNGTIL